MIPWHLLGQRTDAFQRITALLTEGCTIVETGTVRTPGNWAGDGQSTIVWNHFAGELDGHVWTVDIDPNGAELVATMGLEHVTAITSDSVEALTDLASQIGHVDLLYLDSYDVDWRNPEPAAAHHLRELHAATPMLGPGSIVAVDDNRDDIGKGSDVAAHMARLGVPEIVSGYVRAWRLP